MSGAGDGKRLLTADDLAYRWQVNKAHVQRLTREGKVTCVHLGRYKRYSLGAVEAFEASGGAVNQQGATRSSDVKLRVGDQTSPPSKVKRCFRLWAWGRKAQGRFCRWHAALLLAVGMTIGSVMGVNHANDLTPLLLVLLGSRH